MLLAPPPLVPYPMAESPPCPVLEYGSCRKSASTAGPHAGPGGLIDVRDPISLWGITIGTVEVHHEKLE